MENKIFDVTQSNAVFYDLEPRPIRDVFSNLSPAARIKRHVMERRRRKQIEIHDEAQSVVPKAELSAFMVPAEYRSGKSRGRVISDVKTPYDIQASGSKTLSRSTTPVIQLSQLNWQSGGIQTGTSAESVLLSTDFIQQFADKSSSFISEAFDHTYQAMSQSLIAIYGWAGRTWNTVTDFISLRAPATTMPYTAVSYSLEEGAETGFFHGFKRFARIAAPVLIILLVLALPAVDWSPNDTSSGTTGNGNSAAQLSDENNPTSINSSGNNSTSDENSTSNTSSVPSAAPSLGQQPSSTQSSGISGQSVLPQTGTAPTQSLPVGGIGGSTEPAPATQTPLPTTTPSEQQTDPSLLQNLTEPVNGVIDSATQLVQ